MSPDVVVKAVLITVVGIVASAYAATFSRRLLATALAVTSSWLLLAVWRDVFGDDLWAAAKPILIAISPVAVAAAVFYELTHRGPIKIVVNPYGVRYSVNGKHFIVFADVTISNGGNGPESIGAELLIDETLQSHKHVATFRPETVPLEGWERTTWFKRNNHLEFPLNLDGKRTEHGYVAFCVWSMPGPVPDSRNESRLRFVDSVTDKVLHESAQSGLTMLLGEFKPSTLSASASTSDTPAYPQSPFNNLRRTFDQAAEQLATESSLKSIPQYVIDQLDAQQEINELAPKLKEALEAHVGHLTIALTRERYVGAIKDLRARAIEMDRKRVQTAKELDDWVDATTPLIEKYRKAVSILAESYRAQHDWYRSRPEMWKTSQLPSLRGDIVKNLQFARSITDLVLKIREEVRGHPGNHPALDAANARHVVMLDKFIAALRLNEERSLELLGFIDGDGALLLQRP